jgi:hypothetical protein
MDDEKKRLMVSDFLVFLNDGASSGCVDCCQQSTTRLPKKIEKNKRAMVLDKRVSTSKATLYNQPNERKIANRGLRNNKPLYIPNYVAQGDDAIIQPNAASHPSRGCQKRSRRTWRIKEQ